MSDTATTPVKAGPHRFVPPAPGTRDAEFGWCARGDCGSVADSYVHASGEERRRFDSQRDDIGTRRAGQMSQTDHEIKIELRVIRQEGTRRADILASLRKMAAALEAPEDSGWSIVPGSADVYFEGVGDNLAAQRGF